MHNNDIKKDIKKTYNHVVKTSVGYDYSHLTKTQAYIISYIRRAEELQHNLGSFMTMVSFQPYVKDIQARQVIKDIQDSLRQALELGHVSFLNTLKKDICLASLQQARVVLDRLQALVVSADMMSLWQPAIAASTAKYVAALHMVLIEAISELAGDLQRAADAQATIVSPVATGELASWLASDHGTVAVMSQSSSPQPSQPKQDPAPQQAQEAWSPSAAYGPQSDLPIKNVLDRHGKLKNNVDKTLMNMLGQMQSRNDAAAAQAATAQSSKPAAQPKPATAPSTRDGQARLDKIVQIVSGLTDATMADIEQHFSGITRKTLQRDVTKLIEQGRITKSGSRRWAVYNVG